MITASDNNCKSVAKNAIIATMTYTSRERDIATVLKENGLSVTKQRRLVFELLENQEPMSMHELYELSKKYVDRASLYRIIAAYEKLGIVTRVTIGWKYKIELSDKFAEHHHHLTCLQCHEVISINEDELEAVINQLASGKKFKPVEHQIEIQGYCERCQNKSV